MRSAGETLLLFLVLAACGAPGTSPVTPPGGARELRFALVAQGQQAASRPDGPRVAVAIGDAGRDELARAIGQPITAEVGIAVLQGGQRTGGFGVSVERVTLSAGSTVTVRAVFVTPAPDAIVTQVLTSPFVVVSIARSDLPGGTLQFVLVERNGTERARATVENR